MDRGSLLDEIEVRDEPASRTSVAGKIAQIACVVIVLAVFVQASTSYGKSLTEPSNDFHSKIADAYLAGQINLDIDAPKGLIELKDPYDPIANVEFRSAGLHDLSLYEGKLYSYFGPSPAVLLYIPARAFGVELSSTLAALIFVSLGFLFSVLAFRLLTRRFFDSLPVWAHCGAILGLGLAVPAAWIVYIGRGYEVSIACGYFLMFVGIYALARGLMGSDRLGLPWLAVGSLALGLAVAARPSLLGGGILIVGAIVWVFRQHVDQRRAAAVAAITAPFVVVGVALVWYNYARFGSITEFGSSYQLQGENPRTYPFGQLAYIPRAAYYYFLAPPRIEATFPYLYLLRSTLTAGVYSSEPVVGIFSAMPLIPVAVVLGITRARELWRRVPRALLTAIAIGLVGVLAFVVPAYQIRGTSMRYELDFAPLLLFAGLLGAAAWWVSRLSRPFRIVGSMCLGLALGASIAFNLAIISTTCVGTGSC